MACGSARGLVASCSHVSMCVCWYPFTVCRGEYFLTFYFFLLLYLGISSRSGVGRQRVRRQRVRQQRERRQSERQQRVRRRHVSTACEAALCDDGVCDGAVWVAPA